MIMTTALTTPCEPGFRNRVGKGKESVEASWKIVMSPALTYGLCSAPNDRDW